MYVSGYEHTFFIYNFNKKLMKTIIKKDSENNGPIVAIFCGVHGNEKAGIYAMEKALEELSIVHGAVYFVYGNPLAIEKNVRFIEKNLNRCFIKGQNGNSYEEKRAQELMEILDECDAVLDIHASNNPDTVPFVIADSGFDIVKCLPFEIHATGFNIIEPGGTDGYMYEEGKVGICIECGYSGDSGKSENIERAFDSIKQFLSFYNVIDENIEPHTFKQKVCDVNRVQRVTDETYDVVRNFADFETIKQGTLIAKDQNQEYYADRDSAIIFASQGKPIGSESYILGDWK